MTEEWRNDTANYVVYDAISCAFEHAVKETLGERVSDTDNRRDLKTGRLFGDL